MSDRERSMRHERILSLFDWSAGRGLEIGPLFDPVVHRFECDVRYVDVHAGPQLKEYYATHPGVPVDDIVDPDFVLIGPEGTRTLVEAVEPAAPFDWVVASHVIEHVPDCRRLAWRGRRDSQLTTASLSSPCRIGGSASTLLGPRRRWARCCWPPSSRPDSVRSCHLRPLPSASYSIDAADAWRGVRPGPRRPHP